MRSRTLTDVRSEEGAHAARPRGGGERRSRRLPAALVFLVVLSSLQSTTRAQEDPFAAHVRITEPLTPQEEAASFRVPPGFSIELVASEPDIYKPLNLAFDGRGRLWVTASVEYPYAAPTDRPARDKLFIIEDDDRDGRTDRIKTFADGLNVPIGVLPVPGGAVVWSIPDIWLLEDLDGDDRVDRRTRLYGPFGYERDTHGMNNAFRRGFDGWVYACHGFNNQTVVSGRDGHEVRMQSGNTYRFRLDGSRIEQFTWGQVNPFGMAIDARGDLFTADCHSSPIYQLLRGGHYPSFGKPHDGLGFVPEMMTHSHGSTAICGLEVIDTDTFPPEFRGSLYVGNVMTGRVHRDLVEEHGSTLRAREMPDLISTTDPWFRPVDIRLGPDGALYIADFYNRIIGHYEVPLDHPGRDRERGRIWRVAYSGPGARVEPAFDVERGSVDRVIEELGSRNLTRRLLATHALVDRFGASAAAQLANSVASSAVAAHRAHALWALHRLERLDVETLQAAAWDIDPLVRVHVQRILSETDELDGRLRALVLAGLRDSSPFVARAAADAMGRHPEIEGIPALLALLRETPAYDAQLAHTARVALREQLRAPGGLDALAALGTLPDDDAREMADIALAVEGPRAASFLLDALERFGARESNEWVHVALRHIARHADAGSAPTVVSFARERFAADADFQLELARAVASGFAARGLEPVAEMREWGERLAKDLLESVVASSGGWESRPFPGIRTRGDPWVVEERRSKDGVDARFFSSLPAGEQRTGILRSREFRVPRRLSFHLAGHIGDPAKGSIDANRVRLLDARSGELLIESRPPRDDTARRVEWNLEAHEGRDGVIELVDGDDRGAYAWLAAGRFDPPVVEVPALGPGDLESKARAATDLITELSLRSEALSSRLRGVLDSHHSRPAVSARVAQVLVRGLDPRLDALAGLLARSDLPPAVRATILGLVAPVGWAVDEEVVSRSLETIAVQLPGEIELDFAGRLAASEPGARSLLELARRGKTSPRVLGVSTVRTRVLATLGDAGGEEIDALTEGVPPQQEATARLIEERIGGYDPSVASAEIGARVFEEKCAPCHRLGGKGQVIGPQLDGVGGRGVARIVEDLLDPNRNVDIAFRASTWVLRDGRVISGLRRREEGQVIVYADAEGKERTLGRGEVLTERVSELSLMPENVASDLDPTSFYSLLRHLTSSVKAASSD